MTPAEIRALRQSLGLTQAEMAAELGLGDGRRVREIETGARNPGGAMIKLLRALERGLLRPGWDAPAE